MPETMPNEALGVCATVPPVRLAKTQQEKNVGNGVCLLSYESPRVALWNHACSRTRVDGFK